MYSKAAGIASAHFMVACTLSLAFRFLGCGFLISPNVCSEFGSGEQVDQWMFRRQNHEADAIDGVGPGREDLDGFVRLAVHAKFYGGAFASADPVPLCILDAVGPVQVIQVIQESLSKSADAHDPLAHPLADDGMSSSFAEPVLHLVIGQNSAQFGTPINFAIRQVREAELHEDEGLFVFCARHPLFGR